MKKFIISDTHFNHMKMMEYCGRPENFNELIIKNWNSVVGPDDIVIHLGDVILGRRADLLGILAQLNGKKFLARGNHDHDSADWFLSQGFDFVADYFVLDNVAYSHAPLTPLPLQTIRQKSREQEWTVKPVDLNIHGHFHNSTHRSGGTDDGEAFKDRYYDFEYFNKHREKYKLIQIENTLAPFSLDEILKGVKS